MMRKRRTNPHEETCRRVKQAQDAFTMAAAALSEWPMGGFAGGKEPLASALLHGALGMLRMAQADTNMRALEMAEAEMGRIVADIAEREDTLRDADPAP